MYQPNVPRKTTALIQVWGCVLLAIISVFLSFAPLVTLDTGMGGINDMLDKLNLDLGEEYVLPEKVDVSAAKLIGSITLIADVISVSKDTSGSSDKAESLQALLESDSGKNTIITVVAIASTVVNAFKQQDDLSIIGLVLTFLTVLIGLLCVLIFTFIFPIAYIIAALTSLIPALKNMKDPILVAPKLSKKLPGLITMPMTFMLFQCVVPGMNVAYGSQGLWIIAAICVLLNCVVSRLRRYTDKEVLYATVVQGASIVGGIGFIVFFFNIIKTKIFDTFIHGGWASYTVQASQAKKMASALADDASISNAYWIDGIIMLVYLFIILSSTAYFTHCAQRLSCAATRGKKQTKITDNHIVLSVFILLGCIIPMYVKGTENLYKNVTTQTDAYSSLVLEPAQSSALTAALVGAIIMLVAEIAIVVLKKALCSELSEDEMIAVITGKAKEPEAVAAEPAVAAAVVADEAPVEAAPAEEAPAQEAAPEEKTEE